MRIGALIGFLILVLAISGAQQKETPAPNKKPTPTQAPPQQPAPKPAPKIGSLTAKGVGIKIAHARGEGTLTIKGHGFVLVSDLQGEVIMQGFRELKQLPRGVTLETPMDKRVRILHGKGTLTIKGKFNTIRAALDEAEIDFRGGASFEIMGVGSGKLDGQKDLTLNPSAAFTIAVPVPPEWMQPPSVSEAKPPPQGGTLQPKVPEQKPPAEKR
jgi:hypothetical protein